MLKTLDSGDGGQTNDSENMEFRTKALLPTFTWDIHHAHRLLLLGSCFAENMGQYLADNKFNCDINPFGILYNPSSVAKALQRMMSGKLFAEEDLHFHNEQWVSLAHHGSFSAADADTCLAQINRRLSLASENIRRQDRLIITWGTARIYEWKLTGEVVGNCHKFPSDCFKRRLLSVDEIVATYQSLLTELKALHPQLEVLLTVSPIRHLKDGMHENQISKSILLLAADQLCHNLTFCHYFPAYEILMDELRDYRFYADDMVHPSAAAVSYIWECFSEVFFTDSTRQLMQQYSAIRKALAHRPFHPNSVKHKEFLSQILLKIRSLKEKFPYLGLKIEETICREQLEK